MANGTGNNKPASSRTWGHEEYKDDAELSRLYAEFLATLVLPEEWRFIGDVNVISDADIYSAKAGGMVHRENVCFSAGKLYRDMRTSGVNLKEYRVFWNSFSGNGGIVERIPIMATKDCKKTCLIWNKSVEQLNEFIKSKFIDIDKVDSEDTGESPEIERLRNLINNISGDGEKNTSY